MVIKPDLSGQVAVVTGGGRGIGKAVALSLARCKASVIVAARTISEIEAVASAIRMANGKAISIQCDIADEGQINRLFDTVMDKFDKLDIMVNNAAIGRYSPFQNFTTSDLDDLIAVNIRGTYICCREALQRMILQHSGYIINISSVVGFKGYENQSAYTATKHAVVGMTKTLALEAQKYNVRASVIHPGGVDTEMAGEARPDLDRSLLMQPEDIAQSILFLLSLSDRAAVDEIYIRRRGGSPF
jgi:3-oxoacyl-[acyl-carrier protein] reductase